MPNSTGALRHVFGMFLHDIDDTVGYKLYEGASQRARELNIDLYCFIQGTRFEPETTNVCTKLAVNRLDGIICALSPRTSLMSSKELGQYFKSFNLPLISVVENWSDITYIAFDNYQGMRAVLEHLIDIHGLQRIFFIRGPQEHYYADERYRAYMDVMHERGLYDSRLLSPPVDWKPNVNASFSQILGSLKPGKDYDAIAASNDSWAIEAIRCLQERGVNVPEEIAVVGFNDSVQGQSIDPPLTTVGLSFYEQGSQAIDALLELVRGNSAPHELKQKTQLKIRQSCGCLNPNLQESICFHEYQTEFRKLLNQTDQAELIRFIEKVFRAEKLEKAVKYVPLVLNVLDEAIHQGSNHGFFQFINKAAKNTLDSNRDVVIWSFGMDLIFQWVGKNLPLARRKTIYRLRKRALVLFGQSVLEKADMIANQYQEKFWRLHLLLTHLIRIFDLDEMVNFLVESLPKFGLVSCFFVLYEEQQSCIYTDSLPIRSRLLFSYNTEHPEQNSRDKWWFKAEEFLPIRLINCDKPSNLIVTPLYSREYQYGYLICDYRDTSPLAFKMLWPQLATCLRGIHLLEQRRIAEDSLKQQKEDLARSNSELQQFASIASHDLQEPLRKIVTFSGRLKTTCQEILPQQARDYLERIDNAAVRMQILIDGLLTYSRVTTKAQPFSNVCLANIAQEVVNDLEVKIAETKTQLRVDPLPDIEADSLQMRQLFQNMISNGIKFQKPGTIPQLVITTQQNGDTAFDLIFEDNGIGIEPAYHERIFMVFERLHSRTEYEGTGVGLAICKKIIDRHNGNIRIESVPGNGTRFIIRLPLRQNR